MSDARYSRRVRGKRQDSGFTLPELLIAVTVMGLIIAVLAGTVIVTLKNERNTQGRFNVAAAEQQIGMWLPADLASAAAVTSNPLATPCGQRHDVDDVVPDDANDPDRGEWVMTGQTCPGVGVSGGSMALMVGWSTRNQTAGGTSYTFTNVGYYFSPDANGLFKLTRIECVNPGSGWTCTTATVLRDLPGPPGGGTWAPGDVPSWVIQISRPLDVTADDEGDFVIGDAEAKNARRVVVTVNGGGTVSGSGGGSNTISITAGGTNRNTIDAQSLQGAPSFVEARSLCGGPVTLVVDESQSITSSHIDTVRQGVKDFVNALAGTPVKLQIVAFNDRARALSNNTSDWHKYFDMTEPTQVTELTNLITNSSKGIQIGGGGGSGYTNWEDALFHAFRNSDGSTANIIPVKLVIFTDGVPTRDRQLASFRNGANVTPPEPPAPGWGATNTGTNYSQVAFNRANFYANWARSSVKLIGVAVGPDINSPSQWVDNPGAGYHSGWERNASFTYEERATFTYQANYWSRQNFDHFHQYLYEARYQKRDTSTGPWYWVNVTTYNATTPTSNRRDQGWSAIDRTTYESINTGTNHSSSTDGVRRTTTWTAITAAEYNARNTAAGDGDGYRRTPTASPGSWIPITKAEYDLNNTTSNTSDGYTTGWTTATFSKAQYDAMNTTADESDGFRRTPSGSNTWVAITQEQYNLRNTTSDDSDGVRRTGTGGWVEITQAEYDANNTTTNESDGYRTNSKIYAAPYNSYDALVGTAVENDQILGRLVAGDPDLIAEEDFVGEAVKDPNLYSSSQWSQLGAALKAAALGECGGTLTLQTRYNGVPALDPFEYQNSAQTSATGQALSITPTFVVTNKSKTTGVFDFNISDGLWRDVVILPNNLSSLSAYSPVSWECRAGIEVLPVTLVDLPAPHNTSPWKGIRVRVGANEAVSCTQTVTK